MNQLKSLSKNNLKASKPSKVSKTLNSSDTLAKVTNNEFYRNSKYIQDYSHYEPSIEFDLDEQVQSKILKINEQAMTGLLVQQSQPKQSRNFSLPDITHVNQLILAGGSAAAISGIIQENPKNFQHSQSISDQVVVQTATSLNDLMQSHRRASGVGVKNNSNPSLTSIQQREEMSPQQLKALEKLVVIKHKMEQKRKESQRGVLVKRDISHLNNSAAKQNKNSMAAAADSQLEAPNLKSHQLKVVQNPNAKAWNSSIEKENQQDQRARRQPTSISEIGRNMPVSQSLDKILVRRNTMSPAQDIEPLASFFDKVKNSNEENPSLTRNRKRAKLNHRTPRRNVSDMQFALISTRKQFQEQENIIAEENENTYMENGQNDWEDKGGDMNQNFHKLFSNAPGEKLNPSEYLLYSGRKLTGLGTSGGLSVRRIWNRSVNKNSISSIENLPDFDEKAKVEMNSLVSDLKKYVPSALSNAPSSRQDAIGLKEWTETKIESVVKGNEDDDQKLLKCDAIYNLAINEVMRQISMDCSERGEALYKIWGNYLKMFSQFKMKINAESEKTKDALLKENQRQSQVFQETLDKKDSEIIQLKLEILRIESEKKNIQEKCDRAVSKKSKYHQKVEDLKRLLERTKEVIQELRNENDMYVRKQNKKLGPNGRPGHVPLYLAHYKQSYETEEDKFGQVVRIPGLAQDTRSKNVYQDKERSEKIESEVERLISNGDKFTLETQEATERREKSNREQANKGKERDELDTSSDSESPSEHFTYEDLLISRRQMNPSTNMLAFRGVDKAADEIGAALKPPEAKEIEIQTELTMIEEKYNGVLESQKVLEELLAELKLKQQIGDILVETNNIQGEDQNKKNNILAKSFSWYSLGQKSLMEDKMDAIGKFSMEKKKLKRPRGSFKSSKALAFSRGSSLQGSETNSPRSNYSNNKKAEPSKMMAGSPFNKQSVRKANSVSDVAQLEEDEEKRLQGGNQVPKEETMNSEKASGTIENVRLIDLKNIPVIEEQLENQEEGKSTQRSELRGTTGYLKMKQTEPPLDNLEEVKAEIEKTSGFNSTNPEGLGNPSIDEGFEGSQEDEYKTMRIEKRSEKESYGTPKRKNIISLKEFNSESIPTTPKSFNTDDFFQSLEDSCSDPEMEDEPENEYRESMAIIEEAAEEDRASPCIKSPAKRKQSRDGNHESQSHESGNGNGADSKGKGMSMASIVKLKLKASRFVMQMRREDVSVLDKAKLITVTRMYKVEKEKNMALQNTISELEEQLVNEKHNVNKLEDAITDFKMTIKMLEDLKERCPHNKCSICIEELNNELKMQQEELYTLGQESINGLLITSDGRENFAGSKDTNTEIDISEISKVDSRIKRSKKLRSMVLSQQSELGKRREKEQRERFVSSVLEKVKEKKLARFKKYFSLNAVLKQICCLYNERLAQTKENPQMKEESFAVFVYNWFKGSFGFHKVAEQKFIAFAISLKKHLHVVRVNIFARFMGLLDGNVNYSLDELNKYIEGIDFINNSTLGITIVNQDIDNKHYAPFLRGLEYIRFFSENKMPLEEYTEFKREFEAIKEADPKSINKNGILDIDLFMTKILAKYRVICNRTKQFVINAFKAADLDNNKYCSLREFLLIYRYIEPEKYDYNFVENLFQEHADIKIKGQLSLSFDKFTIICVEYSLFNDAQQDAFLDIHTLEDLEENINILQNNWSIHYERLERKVKSLEHVPEEERQYWLDVLKILQEKISSPEGIITVEFKPLLMSYRIFNLEIDRLKEAKEERKICSEPMGDGNTEDIIKNSSSATKLEGL